MRLVSLERRATWARHRCWRWTRLFLGRGEITILGGLAAGMYLDAASFSPSGAQASLMLEGSHEMQVQQALLRSAAPGDVVWDVGANIGFVSLVAARIVGAEGRVLAIEPDPPCVHAIRRVATLNGLSNVDALQAAAAATSGSEELIIVSDPLWSRLASVGDHEQATRRTIVKTVALDELELPAPAVVKIDVEGAELDVLDGMARLLAEDRPIVICEMHGKNAAFCDHMEARGYLVRNLDGPQSVREADGNVHVICEPTEAFRSGPVSPRD